MPALDAATSLPTYSRAWSRGIALALRENSLLLGFTLFYVALVNLAAAIYHVPYTSFHLLGGAYPPFVAICILALAIAFIVWLLRATLIRRLSVRSAAFWRDVTTDFMSRERVLQALPVLLLWPLFINTFSLGKSLIPLVQPFYLDQALVALDRTLHGGIDPWRLLQPLLGHPLVTYLLDKSYALWFFALYISLLLQAAALGGRRLRMQFLLSSILAWALLGNVAATLLSSAGPCFYVLIGGDDSFAPLMAYLHGVADGGLNLIALTAQDFLWSKYEAGQFVMGSGISAAPSMHIATAWLIARLCQARRIQGGSGRLAIAAWILLGCILIGSVHLGWHYAVDGYLGIACAWAIWRAVGWLLKRPAIEHALWPRPAAEAAD
jgi:hypothetical protein